MSIGKDPKRIFDATQKKQIYINANGHCQSCDIELENIEWEAHHVVPHSQGGQTKVENGQALCVECHRFTHREERDKLSNTISNFKKDYSWQERAIQKYFDQEHLFYRSNINDEFKPYVVEVSPSGGKTIFSMKLAKELINKDMIDRVVFLVPRDSIKLGFSDDCKRAGNIIESKQTPLGGECMAIETSTSPKNIGVLRNHHGLVITYHALNDIALEYLEFIASKHRLLFVFDEAHHGADSRNDEAMNTWGRNMNAIKDIAHSIVAMTGTPLRADNKTIPFVEYEERIVQDIVGNEKKVMEVIPSFKFSYVNAVKSGVARRLLCVNVDPIIEYSVNDDIKNDYLSAIPNKELKHIDYTPLDAKDGVIDEMLIKANEEIDRMRRNGDPDAACLVVGRRNSSTSKDSLKIIANKIDKLFSISAVTVESADGEDARKKIKSFKRGTSKFIVAKDMISEGTNIPRIRVVCILRKIGNKTFYEQLVHRSTRNDSDSRPEDAVIFQLSYLTQVIWGKELEDSTQYLWLPEEKTGEPGAGGGAGGEDEDDIFGISASLNDDINDDVLIGGENFSDTDPIAKVLFDDLSHTGVARWQFNFILRNMKNRNIPIDRIIADDFGDDEQPTKQQELELILEKTTKIVRQKVYYNKKADYQENAKEIWNTIKRMSGVPLNMKNSEIIAKHANPEQAINALYNNAKKFRWSK